MQHTHSKVLQRLNHTVIRAGIAMLALAVVYAVYQRVLYTFGFTDEGDNIAIGQFLLHGQQLYTEVFSQHQPLTYYLSAAIQLVTNPDNVLLVIRRHRQFVMAFSFLWAVFLIVRFGLVLLPAIVVVEIGKYYLLGHLFLAEGLVIYPLVYLFLLWWRAIGTEKLRVFEAIAASLSAFFVVFNLLPTAPAVGFTMAVLLYQNRQTTAVLLALVLPALLATAVLFTLVPIDGYIEGTLWANLGYYIPQASRYAFNIEQSRLTTAIAIVAYPFTTFFREANILIQLYRLLSIAWVAGAVTYFGATRRYKEIGFALLLLIVANPRPAFASNIFFHAFHSLPFFALFVVSIAVLFGSAMRRRVLRGAVALTLLPVIAVFGVLLISPDVFYREDVSSEDIAYINFAEVFTYSSAINTLSADTDTLAVIPHEELLYWYPGLRPATRFLFYEAWVYDVPKFRAEITTGLRQNPPTFVYWPEDDLEPFLKTDDYVSVPRNTATFSALHVHHTKVPEITNRQWEQLSVHGFRKP